jgi:hypothetical protein
LSNGVCFLIIFKFKTHSESFALVEHGNSVLIFFFFSFEGILKALLYRDILMSLGFLDVSKDSLKIALTQKGPGHSVIIVIGGAAEVIFAHKDIYHFKLKNRKGFARLALETG